jgi:exodeoxyribonuclease VII large subunit
MAEEAKIWTVGELTRLIKDVLEQSFYPFWVVGEVSNLTIHRSGHVYFTLKDRNSQVSCVFFRGAQAARESGMAEGTSLEVHGRLGVYEPRGQYQLVVNQIRARGLGELQQRFEELKARLRAEGLFDEDRKRPIPRLPSRIGLVTSPSGAAVRDFLQILGRRFANMGVRIYPATVQGAAAAEQIARGIEHFNREGGVDVIVVTRGGGSLEDLWPFNEERVARAIAGSALPVVSGVGHEVDFTISDFAADLRAPTPSAAAELVVQGRTELRERIETLRRRVEGVARLRLAELRNRVQRAARSPVFLRPESAVRMQQQRVDEVTYRLEGNLRTGLQRAHGRLEKAQSTLAALNPTAVLSRGYAILIQQQGKAVRTSQQVAPGERLRGVLGEGEIALAVVGQSQ